jgi:DNA polymerase
MLKAEERYGNLIGHTHDELFLEVRRGFNGLEEFEELICDLPAWTAGLPMSAEGFVSKRYRK